MHQQVKQSRRAFCGSITRLTATLAFLPLSDLLASCNPQPKKGVFRPGIQINNTDVITNSRYMGNAFAFPEQMVSAALEPKSSKIPPYAPGISFLGVIAQDTLSTGCSRVTPCDIAFVGLFKQQNGTLRYGYQINGVRHYTSGHVQGHDYRYIINFNLNEEGLVADPAYPHQKRFGYAFQIVNGLDSSTRLHSLQSSPFYANQLFVGVMDDNNNVRLPDNKQLQLYISVAGSEETPNVIYKNDDDTSQISSQFSSSENRIILTLTGSY